MKIGEKEKKKKEKHAVCNLTPKKRGGGSHQSASGKKNKTCNIKSLVREDYWKTIVQRRATS